MIGQISNNIMIEQISNIVRDKKCTTFDALLLIIEDQDLEPSEVIKELPQSIIEQLKQDAIADGKLRPSMIELFQKTFLVDDFFY